MADEIHLRTVRLTAKSLTQNFGLPGTEDYRSHPSDRGLDNPETIFSGMKQKDSFDGFDPKLLKGTIYSLKNRSIISRWVRDVCAAFNLKSTTLCLAVMLTDRFILKNLQALQLSECQLAAITCVWIAAKFEELDAMLPSLRSLVEVCDGAYTKEQVVDMEESILSSFRWKLPHTTVNNYLYLYLHLLTDPKFVAPIPLGPVPADDRLTVKLVKPPGQADVLDRNSLRVVNVVIPYSQPLSSALPTLMTSLGVTSTRGSLECYRLSGEDVVLARRLDSSLSPAKLGLQVGESLFLATTASSAVFTERDAVTLLRPLNTMMLHMCETLLQQTLIHPEFLKVGPHLSAMAVLILTRCLLTPNTESFQQWANNICRTLSISRSNTVSVCELLVEKYKNVFENDQASLVQPVVQVPLDIHDRILMAFGRKQ